MPAIRFTNNGFTGVVTHVSAGKSARVKLAGGEWVAVEFLGFICERGAALAGFAHRAKIAAYEVTCENTSLTTNWRSLSADRGEYVVGVLSRRNALDGKGAGWCVHVLVDEEGWPIIRGGDRPQARRSVA